MTNLSHRQGEHNPLHLPLMSGADSAPYRLSIIIPCWGDESRVETLRNAIPTLPQIQWVVAHTAASPAFTRQLEALGIHHIACPAPNRGAQLRAGSSIARGAILLFHHADTDLTPLHLQSLLSLSDDLSWSWGAFYRKFDQRHPALIPFEPVERWHNRTFGAIYGDQSIFIRRDHCLASGGFANIPLMEDVEFSLRLRRSSPPRMIDPPIASSPRKHLTRGPWRTTFHNLIILWAFHLGVCPHRLHRWYYRTNGNNYPTQASQSTIQ